MLDVTRSHIDALIELRILRNFIVGIEADAVYDWAVYRVLTRDRRSYTTDTCSTSTDCRCESTPGCRESSRRPVRGGLHCAIDENRLDNTHILRVTCP